MKPLTTTNRAFWIDYDHDRKSASDGVSRFHAYVRDRAHQLRQECDWCEDPTVPFAVGVWRIARGPVMVPPLVDSDSRVLNAALSRASWDGSLLADVTVIVPNPTALHNVRPVKGGWFRGWEYDRFQECFEGPTEEQVTRGPALLTTTQLITALPADGLPKLSEFPAGDLERTAWQAIEALVPLLNQHVRPVLDALDDPAHAAR